MFEAAAVAAHVSPDLVEKVAPLWQPFCAAEQARLQAAGAENICVQAETMLVKALARGMN